MGTCSFIVVAVVLEHYWQQFQEMVQQQCLQQSQLLQPILPILPDMLAHPVVVLQHVKNTTLTINFGAPVATAQSGGTCTQLRANWNAVAGATSYRLDVATDAGFTSMVINNLNVGNVTSYDLNLPPRNLLLPCKGCKQLFYIREFNVIGLFTLSNPANNDAFRNAIDITANLAGGGAYTGSFNNSTYGLEAGEPRPRDVYASAWYKFTTPAGGFTNLNANVVTADNSVRTLIEVMEALALLAI